VIVFDLLKGQKLAQFAYHGEAPVNGFSDVGSTPTASTRRKAGQFQKT